MRPVSHWKRRLGLLLPVGLQRLWLNRLRTREYRLELTGSAAASWYYLDRTRTALRSRWTVALEIREPAS